MELVPMLTGHSFSSGINDRHASGVIALLPTRTLVESLCAASVHVPPSTFLWAGSHLKIAFKATTSYPGTITCSFTCAGDRTKPTPRIVGPAS